MNFPLTLTNTLSGKKELFKPLNDKKINLYVCGITPYDYSHLGHGRCYVTFDVLYRLLKFLGFNVAYCRNFTDIDDKLLTRAERELNDKLQFAAIATKFINAYHEDMQALNCLLPNVEPRVTEHIKEIITFIEGLIERDKAYVVDGDVYFSIDSFNEYGKLSKRDLKDLHAGARVAINEKKKNPLDFALWKSEAEGTFWQSPWGWGRPGWHIECSALAGHYLGETIDIHGGGMDLIFPHHENEVAQSEALHQKPLSRWWVHNAFVRINQEKMSKSLGNFFTLRSVFEHYDSMLVRFMILNHHYRSPLDFSFEDLDAFYKSYQRLCRFFENDVALEHFSHADVTAEMTILVQMLTFMCDDLNTPGMFGVLFENLSILQNRNQERLLIKSLLTTILGLKLTLLPEKTVEVTPEIEQLLEQREKARQEKDWKKSDALRDQLKALGYEVRDKRT